jgi:hypothetical protein
VNFRTSSTPENTATKALKYIRRSGRLLALGISLSFAGLAQGGETMRFVHAAPEVNGDERAAYFWDLLGAALESNRDTYGDYVIESYPVPMNYARTVAEMSEGGQERVNVFVPATNPDLETRLLPIRIPADKGLLGYRALLIVGDTQSRLEAVRNADDLRRFTIGQGAPWADSRILEANGFNLVLANEYAGLFKMLGAGRFDVFSRGVDEIRREWLVQKDQIPGLQIERNLILHYPMPRFFFVPRTERGKRMAERIEDGLRRLAKSGEFDRRYAAYKRHVLAGLDLAGRRVLHVDNPYFKSTPPYDDKRWWDDLSQELRADRKCPPAKSTAVRRH